MSRLIEEWKPVLGYEGLYEVSDWGNVRNRHGKLIRKTLSRQHLRVHLWKNGEGKHFFVHRLVAEAWIPNPENKPIVGHTKPLEDGSGREDSTANEIWNIAWMTYQENRMFGTCNERIRNSQLGREFTEEHKKNISESLKNSEIFHDVVTSLEYRKKLSDVHKGKQLNRKDLSQEVHQIDKVTGEVLAVFPSAKEASRRTGFAQSNISRNCNGGFFYKDVWHPISQAYDFIWQKVPCQLRLEHS